MQTEKQSQLDTTTNNKETIIHETLQKNTAHITVIEETPPEQL